MIKTYKGKPSVMEPSFVQSLVLVIIKRIFK